MVYKSTTILHFLLCWIGFDKLTNQMYCTGVCHPSPLCGLSPLYLTSQSANGRSTGTGQSPGLTPGSEQYLTLLFIQIGQVLAPLAYLLDNRLWSAASALRCFGGRTQARQSPLAVGFAPGIQGTAALVGELVEPLPLWSRAGQAMLVPESKHTDLPARSTQAGTLCGDLIIHVRPYCMAARAIKAFYSIPYMLIVLSFSLLRIGQ